jgi:hypothetical protein
MDVTRIFSNNMVSLAENLVDCGFDVNTLLGKGMSPLFMAVYNGHCSMAEFLLRSGADPSLGLADGSLDPLYVAVSIDNAVIVRELLLHGVDLTRRYLPWGCSILSVAFQHASHDLIKLLINSGTLICSGDIRYVLVNDLIDTHRDHLLEVISSGLYDSSITYHLLSIFWEIIS